MTELLVAGLAYFEVVVPPYPAPAPGEETFVEGIGLALGGALNTATVAAALGLEVALSVPLGKGVADHAVESVARRLAIALHPIAARDNPAVSLVFAGVDDRAFVSAADFAALEQLAELPAVKWIHVPGLEEAARLTGALARARQAGARVSVSASWSPARLGRLAAMTNQPWDLLVLNEKEAAAACGDAATAPERLRGAARSVLVTAGARGAFGVLAGEPVRASAEAATVVDVTGAGDAFCAGVLAALSRGAAPAAAMQLASRAAARVVAQAGGLVTERTAFADLARELAWKS